MSASEPATPNLHVILPIWNSSFEESIVFMGVPNSRDLIRTRRLRRFPGVAYRRKSECAVGQRGRSIATRWLRKFNWRIPDVSDWPIRLARWAWQRRLRPAGRVVLYELPGFEGRSLVIDQPVLPNLESLGFDTASMRIERGLRDVHRCAVPWWLPNSRARRVCATTGTGR